MTGHEPRNTVVDAAEFRALYSRLQQASNRGSSDRRGALDNLTPGHVLAAAQDVRSGKNVSLARPIEVNASPDNPEPCRHEMVRGLGRDASGAGLHFAADRITMNVHGDADSHIDALCHVIYDGRLYNGVDADTLTPSGASVLSIGAASDGIVGRGVLLDITRVRGTSWLEPGDFVTADDLAAAERAQHLRVGQGDLLFVRVGHSRRRTELGPWNAAEARAGLHPAAMEFVAERRVSVLGSDGNSDTAPSTTEGVGFPVHVLAINAMGLPLLDYLRFEDLVEACEAEDRWSFLCVIAPLRLPTATGSPVNPIAIV